MPTVTVTVYRNGEPVKGARVALGADPLDGVYGPEYADYDGVAEFEVEYGQGGDVFVNGSPEDHWGASSRTDITVNL
jgi:hypothetical protein